MASEHPCSCPEGQVNIPVAVQEGQVNIWGLYSNWRVVGRTQHTHQLQCIKLCTGRGGRGGVETDSKISSQVVPWETATATS